MKEEKGKFSITQRSNLEINNLEFENQMKYNQQVVEYKNQKQEEISNQEALSLFTDEPFNGCATAESVSCDLVMTDVFTVSKTRPKLPQSRIQVE